RRQTWVTFATLTAIWPPSRASKKMNVVDIEKPLSSIRRTVRQDRACGHPASFLRCQERDDRCNLARLADPLERRGGFHGGTVLRRCVHHAGADCTGNDCVDRDVARCQR